MNWVWTRNLHAMLRSFMSRTTLTELHYQFLQLRQGTSNLLYFYVSEVNMVFQNSQTGNIKIQSTDTKLYFKPSNRLSFDIEYQLSGEDLISVVNSKTFSNIIVTVGSYPNGLAVWCSPRMRETTVRFPIEVRIFIYIGTRWLLHYLLLVLVTQGSYLKMKIIWRTPQNQ